MPGAPVLAVPAWAMEPRVASEAAAIRAADAERRLNISPARRDGGWPLKGDERMHWLARLPAGRAIQMVPRFSVGFIPRRRLLAGSRFPNWHTA